MATERIGRVRSVALGLWIAAGSRVEPAELGGVSHFIEHLLFKGSDRFSQLDIARIFDDMGGDANASTSKEHTVVDAHFLDDDLDTAFDVLAEMVARPAFRELDQEREVVLEEVAMYEDSPPELVHDHLFSAVFGEHPLGRPIIGTRETLAGLDLDIVRIFHEGHYVNPGIVVSAAGHVDHDHLCELALRHFRPEPGADVRTPELSVPASRHVARFACKDTEQYHVCLGGPGPRRADPERYAVSVVNTILGGSSSSRLFQEIREQRGLVYSIYSFVARYADAGLTGIYFGSRRENVEAAAGLVLGILEDLHEDVADDTLKRAKNYLKVQHVLGAESPGNRMHTMGQAVLMGQPVLTVDEVLQRIDAVTHDDVVAAVARYYDLDTWSTVCIGPDREPLEAVTGSFAWERG